MVHGGGTAGARHVADDDVRPARDVFRQMPLIDPRLGVGIAADRVVDQEGEGLVLVELRRGGGSGQKQGGDQSDSSRHASLLPYPPLSSPRKRGSITTTRGYGSPPSRGRQSLC